MYVSDITHDPQQFLINKYGVDLFLKFEKYLFTGPDDLEIVLTESEKDLFDTFINDLLDIPIGEMII